MRINFQEIHELMAIELITCIYEKDANANKFLLFYNGNTMVINNIKYKTPSLETEDGQQWNNASLIGICNLWTNTKKKKKGYEERLVETNMKIGDIEDKLLYIQPEKEAQEVIIKETELRLNELNKTHTELDAKLKYLRSASLHSSDYFALLAKFEESEKKVFKEKDIIKEAKAHLDAIKEANMSTYVDLDFYTNQKKQLLQDVKAQNLNIDTKNFQMDPILRSISKVLMERTKIID